MGPNNNKTKADRTRRRSAFAVEGKGGNPPETLKKRREFLKVAQSGKRFVTPGFILQIGEENLETTKNPSFGYTTSKKVGNAVERNRVRRQLREVARLVLAKRIKTGRNYVLVGRRGALKIPFAKLVKDAKWALRKMGLEKTS